MGYTTYFEGQISVHPALSEEEKEYLEKFSSTRRMHRKKGPYFVDGSGFQGQGDDKDIISYNSPDPTQPGLWCQWISNDDGTAIVWDGNEKFYYSAEWMEYLINHFFGSNPIAAQIDPNLSFLQGHKLNGIISAEGEDEDDVWFLQVKDNVVSVLTEYEYENLKLETTQKPSSSESNDVAKIKELANKLKDM